MRFSTSALSLATTLQFLSCKGFPLRPASSTLGFVTSIPSLTFGTKRFSTDERSSTIDQSLSSPQSSETDSDKKQEIGIDELKSPWARENNESFQSGKINSRFRQHVNPLSRKYQMLTELNNEWPNDGTFSDLSLPLHIDIGCGKGGFLLDLATQRRDDPMNYLGLEIRPSVALYAKDRVEKKGLTGKVDFIGCNANVDLERIVKKYAKFGEIDLVSIQYPDPHFKKSHQKRRVVTEQLVLTLAKYLKEEKEVFIQSDIKDVLDNMRETIREFGSDYFIDTIQDLDEYMEENPIGVPTEREVSVLDKDLPVYRTVFRRTSAEYV